MLVDSLCGATRFYHTDCATWASHLQDESLEPNPQIAGPSQAQDGYAWSPAIMESFQIDHDSDRSLPKTTCFPSHALELLSVQCHWNLFDHQEPQTHEVGRTQDQDVEIESFLPIQGLAAGCHLCHSGFPVHEKHAQTTSGDHGTGTQLELGEALFLLSDDPPTWDSRGCKPPKLCPDSLSDQLLSHILSAHKYRNHLHR